MFRALANLLSAAEVDRLLEGLDEAFEAALHSRFGGGIEAYVMDAGALGDPISLRTARAGGDIFLRLQLYPSPTAPGPASAPGLPVGTVRLSAPPDPQIEDVTVLTEIFEDRDPNEAGDATSLASGVVMRAAPDGLGPAGLLVIRSREAGVSHDDQALQSQRAWRPMARRHAASEMLGAAGRSHRASVPPRLALPVAADLLHRIGGAIAGLGREFGLVAVLIDPGL